MKCMMSNSRASTYASIVSVALLSILAPALAGCGNGDPPPATKAGIQAADAKRQAYIDTLNIPESQKAIMKSHLGGPAVPSPAGEAAKRASDRR